MSDAEDFAFAFLTAIENGEVIGNEDRWYTETRHPQSRGSTPPDGSQPVKETYAVPR